MDLLQSVIKNEDDQSLTLEDFKNITRAVSKELEVCQQSYQTLRHENRESLRQYKSKTGQIAKQWMTVRQEISSLLEECLFVNNLNIDGIIETNFKLDTFVEHQRRQLYLMAGECALSDDLDSTSLHYEGEEYCVRQVTLELINKLKESKSEIASRLYVRLYARQHADRLAALPQAAVLFLSECHVLSLNDCACEDLRLFGAQFLQQHINVLLDEIYELADNGGAVCLDAENIEHILKRPYKQLLFQLSRFQNVLFECTKAAWLRDVYERTMILLTRALCDALWKNILDATGGITKGSHVVLNDIIQSVIDFSNQNGQSDYVTLLKLVSLSMLFEQPLLTWMGAFRKKTTHPALTTFDYFLLIKSFFSESSLYTSCLNEIEHELEEEQEEQEDGEEEEEGEDME